MDDVYLTLAERLARGQREGPLFAVRGPPGTHDLALAARVIRALRSAGPMSRTPIPSFDKLADDRRPRGAWTVFEGRPSAVIVDCWSLGATPQSQLDLDEFVNELERAEDGDCRWRTAVNAALEGPYAAFDAMFDARLYLRPPTFDVVLDWRVEQEAGLLGVTPEAVSPARRSALARFVAHYERLTRWMMAGGVKANFVAQQGLEREILSVAPMSDSRLFSGAQP